MEKNPKKELFKLYRGSGLIHLFLRLRWWHANIPAVERLLPRRGRIIDLGCGHGFITNYIALAEPAREVIGIDSSVRRIELADRGLPNTTYIHTDILDWDGVEADGILISDLLHHLFSPSEQSEVIDKALRLLRPGGRLVIKEIDTSPRWKFFFTRLLDRTFYARKERYLFIRREEMLGKLEAKGLSVEIKLLARHRPVSHIAYVCTKG